MTGKTAAAAIVIAAVLTAVSVWYLQVYYYYSEVEQAEIRLTPASGGAPEAQAITGFEGIDASSSPLRFRACLTLEQPLDALRDRYALAEEPTPLTGPGWFDCYDADAIGEDLEAGEAIAFMGEKDIATGVDRLVAVYPDGRAYVWHQLNELYQD